MNSFTFNGTDLSTITGVTITKVDDGSTPKRKLISNKLARNDKSVLTSAEYESKNITVTGIIGGTDYGDVYSIINTLKSYIQTQNATVQVPRAGATLEYYNVTLDGMSTKVMGGSCEFTLQFMAADPIARESTSLQFLQPQHTAVSAVNYSVVNNGTYLALPYIKVTVSSLTGGTGQSITVSNDSLGQGIIVTRTWAAGDILEIDSLNKTVYINSQIVAYTGLFPQFNAGTSSLGYIDTFTNRHVRIESTYVRRFA